MGKKHDNVDKFICKYCGKKYDIQDLEERGYIYDTKLGKAVECPNTKCQQQQFLE